MASYFTSHDEMDMDDFIDLMEEDYGYLMDPNEETARDDEVVFTDGVSSFAAWEEGDRIGARSIPRDVGDLFAAEGTAEYDEYNGIDDTP